jgi:hypothetical protein
MTTLNGLMLDAVKLVSTVRESTATGGTTTTIADTKLTEQAGTYTGGTAWILSGTYSGQTVVVKTHGQNSLTLDSTLAGAIIAGVEYAVADAAFPMWMLKQSIMHVLKKTDIPATTTVTATAGQITLAAGVSNVKRVIVDTEENFHWEEKAGKIYFDSDSVSGTCTLWYLMPASDYASLSTSVPDAIDPNYIAWGAAAYLWRQLIQRINKDNPTAIEMMNEAKVNEAQALQTQRRYDAQVLKRAPRHAKWGV